MSEMGMTSEVPVTRLVSHQCHRLREDHGVVLLYLVELCTDGCHIYLTNTDGISMKVSCR